MTAVELGATAVPISVPRFGDLLDVYVTITCVEALPVLETHAVLGPLGDEAASRLHLGRLMVGSREHTEALAVREQIRADVVNAFGQCDVLISPTVPLTAPMIGRAGMADPLARPRTDWWTVEANLASVPALSVPAGLGKGLPVGVQLMARTAPTTASTGSEPPWRPPWRPPYDLGGASAAGQRLPNRDEWRRCQRSTALLTQAEVTPCPSSRRG